MMLGAFETLYDRTPPAWMRKVEVAALMGVFAEAFDVEPPATEDLSAERALDAFRTFTAACMEAVVASGDEHAAQAYRARLGAGAQRLGAKVRRVLAVRPSNAFRVARFFYRGIGIEIAGEVPGSLRFGPCSFAARYTSSDCWFMSAFDEGFLRGLSGAADASLTFSCRLTQGAPACEARFGRLQSAGTCSRKSAV